MQITAHQKNEISEALDAYIASSGLTQQQVEKLTGVNSAYLIQIRRRVYSLKSGDRETPIKDKYFKAIADTIGFPLTKVYWETRGTIQTKEILSILADSKGNLEPAVIVGETGCGKSYSCELFRRKHPLDTIVVRAGSTDTLKDLLNKVVSALNPPYKVTSKAAMVRMSSMILERMSYDGHKPMIIIDEAEYMSASALCAWKELYDNLNGLASLVLVGTDQLLTNLDRMRMANRAGIPQLYRRIRYRIRRLSPIDRSFNEFLKDYPVPLQKWLRSACNNYGELHDVLVTALREADRTGEELDEAFIKMVLGI